MRGVSMNPLTSVRQLCRDAATPVILDNPTPHRNILPHVEELVQREGGSALHYPRHFLDIRPRRSIGGTISCATVAWCVREVLDNHAAHSVAPSSRAFQSKWAERRRFEI